MHIFAALFAAVSFRGKVTPNRRREVSLDFAISLSSRAAPRVQSPRKGHVGLRQPASVGLPSLMKASAATVAKPPEATKQTIGWVTALIANPVPESVFAEHKGRTVIAQENLVKGLEAAMLAWQASLHTSDQLDLARAEHVAAQAKAKEKSSAAKKFVEGQEQAEQAAEEAKLEVARALSAVELATVGATNAVELAEAAKQAADDAQDEVTKATDEYDKAQAAVKEQEETSKAARKALDRAAINVDETKKQITSATSNISKTETNAASKAEKASDAARRSYEAQAYRDECEERYESAARAADDLEGVWLDRHLKKLKQLEAEYKKALANSQKMQREEETSEAASVDAQALVGKSQQDLALRKTEADEAIATISAAGEKLSLITQGYEVATKEENASKLKLETATKNLKAAQTKAKKTTVARAEENLETAKQTMVEVTQKEKEKARQAARAKDLMVVPVAESEAASAIAKVKAEAVEAAEQPERDALAKEEPIMDLVIDYEKSISAMAMAVYVARHDQAPFWSEEENEEKAEQAKVTRLAMTTRDIRLVATGKDRAKNMQSSPIDKWLVFKQMVDHALGHHKGEQHPEFNATVDNFNVHRLFYELDGEMVQSITMMVSGIIGLALDRGPPVSSKCKVKGAGLSQASVNQISTFTIVSCSEQGIQFDDGGDTFRVIIRYSALGRQNIRTKIVDGDDGQYTVTFKPSSAGKCTIQAMLVSRDGSKAEDLPGSPFSCVVSSFSGPKPVPSECQVTGDALTKVVAQTPQNFYINFRDALGQLSHACDLDVWVQPIDKVQAVHLVQVAETTGEAPQISPGRGMFPKPVDVDGYEVSQPIFTPEVAQLLAHGPPGALETLVVGQRPLEVSSTPDILSRTIARHAPTNIEPRPRLLSHPDCMYQKVDTSSSFLAVAGSHLAATSR